MLTQLRTATLMLLVMTVLTGGVYPFVVTAVAQVAFPPRANGSLITVDNRVIGSELIGQSFTEPRYFWGRLSATSPVPYNAAASSGSNYGPLHPGLQQAAQARTSALAIAGSDTKNIPVDLVTASASGLDPHISPAAAEYQVARVAAARQLTEIQVRELVQRYTCGRQWGVFGEPCVHVLQLNLALDDLQNLE